MIALSLCRLCQRRFYASINPTVSFEKLGDRKDVAMISPKASASDISLLELMDTVSSSDIDPSIRVTVIAFTSSWPSTFPSSSDSFSQSYTEGFLHRYDTIARCLKPTVALVDGDLAGILTEMAISCDIVYASDRSTFAMDHILKGCIPGLGGTQRLPRSIGKSLAMEMILSGEPITARDAKQAGLISKVIPIHRLLKEGVSLGNRLGDKSSLIQSMVKEAVDHSYETSLREGLVLESKLFRMTFGTKDKMEGMTAHFERRKPKFIGE